MQCFDDYSEAVAACPEGHSVCGTYRDDVPVYFVLPDSASREEAARQAFRARHGRTMNRSEETLTNMMALEDTLNPSKLAESHPYAHA